MIPCVAWPFASIYKTSLYHLLYLINTTNLFMKKIVIFKRYQEKLRLKIILKLLNTVIHRIGSRILTVLRKQ